MIDQNRDGFIDKDDLHDMLASLGKNPTDDYLDSMMNEAPGPINFTMFSHCSGSPGKIPGCHQNAFAALTRTTRLH
ncbi:Myosin regulatory light polypeptide 9-like [Homarus americanus]|uniref:Myosin regulatory light polypeptide 9-like n=1 Tax=Homarus americanus TaxID=6706 RepID=A0A8J5MP27_HOMAM|nr:Myosin regulatory light polypeptide 9-like [Homarus americanus]